MSDPTPLMSPAAQAVEKAAHLAWWITRDDHCSIAAAALRAAADQVVPREPVKDPLWASSSYEQRADIRAHILAIATELEAQQ